MFGTSHPHRESVALVIADLQMGGAQRVLAALANAWTAGGTPVTVVTLAPGIDAPFFRLDDGVRRIGLDATGRSEGARGAVRNNVQRIARLRSTLSRLAPRAVVSFMDQTNVLTILATRGLGSAVIVSERIDPDHQPLAPAWEFLRAATYPRADAIVVQTDAVRRRAAARWRAAVEAIPNPVAPPDRPLIPRTFPSERGTIVSAGRLDRQKGLDVLLEAFARIAPAHPGWELEIWGIGPQRAALETLRVRLDLETRVRFPGAFREPADALARADLFVLASRWEGYPNALCEAMAWGLPVIATDCPSGPAEIVTPGLDGELVPPEDPAALAQALGTLIGNPARRRALASRAGGIVDRLGIGTILARWDRTIAQAGRRRAVR